MTIEEFKELSHGKKIIELKYSADLLGSYLRNAEDGGEKTPGDIYALYDFWVFLSDDEKLIIPTRRNPLPPAKEDEQEEEK